MAGVARGQGGVRQRRINGTLVWEARYYDEGKRKSVYGKTQKGVLANLRQAQTLAADGLKPPSKRLTVEHLLTDWLDEREKLAGKPGGLALNTYAWYETYVRRYLIPGLGHFKLTALEPRDVDRFLTGLVANGQTPYLANACRRILRIALNDALRNGDVLRNVAALAKPLRWDEDEIVPLTVEEAQRLVDFLEEADLDVRWGGRLSTRVLKPMTFLVLTMGLREQEVLGLQTPNLNLERQVLRVRTALIRYKGDHYLKGTKSSKHVRDLKMPDFVSDSVAGWLDFQEQQRKQVKTLWGNSWDLVFTTDTGQPIDRTAVSKAFSTVLEAAGLPHKRFYDLRHGAGTYMLLQGHDLRVVQAQLGHTNIVTTTRYTHLMREMQDSVANSMETLLRRVPKGQSSGTKPARSA